MSCTENGTNNDMNMDGIDDKQSCEKNANKNGSHQDLKVNENQKPKMPA
jgi:hypothetical protein